MPKLKFKSLLNELHCPKMVHKIQDKGVSGFQKFAMTKLFVVIYPRDFLRSLCLPPLIVTGNLFVTSKTKPPIHHFTNLNYCKKASKSFKTNLYWCIISFYYFTKNFKPCFIILKVFKDILQHF